MKAEELQEYSKPVLAGAVKLSQRKQLIDASGKNWHDWVQAQPTGKKLSDPRKYSPEQLAGFLAALHSQKPDPRAPGKELVKPQKLLKRFLPWFTNKLQSERAASGGSAAAAAAGGKAAGGKPGKGKAAAAAAAGKGAADAAADQQQVQKGDPVWQLMQRTRSHPRFHHWYNFDSYEKGWVVTGRDADGDAADAAAAGDAGVGPWRLLGVDCEMCATSESDKELLQLAVVDEDDQLVMQELVLPSCPVLDYRTELTGITASDLQGVTLSRKAAAKRLAKLLTPRTVLVGHGLHHDLQALQLDHPWVIDTSMIFEVKDLSTYTPSLALLSEQLLGQPLRGRTLAAPVSSSQQQPQHDSREDASVSLALVKRELQRGTPSPPLETPDLKVDKADLCKLCVHKLPPPSSSSPKDVAAAVKATLAAASREAGHESAAAAVEAAAVEQPGDSSKQLLFLVFQHAGVANEVFSALPGVVFTDSVGRHSKKQALQGSPHKVVVRKMACHSGLAYGKDKAADRGAKRSGSSNKKRKAPGSAGKRQTAAAAAAAKKAKKAKKVDS